MSDAPYEPGELRPRPGPTPAATAAVLGRHYAYLREVLSMNLPPSRERSLALTALEDSELRAHRAVFGVEPLDWSV